MKFWIYYILAGLTLLHPHLSQKIEMLINYFSHPEYEFWTTFSTMDLLDLILHAGLPILLIVFGIRKQKKEKNAV
jgi:hypothetical protein